MSCRRVTLSMPENFAVKPFALVLAVYWSLQGLVCLPIEFGDHDEGHRAEHQSAAIDHHHDHSSVASQASADLMHGRPMDSNGAPSDHHQDSNGDCERHCASLNQTIAATTPAVFVPGAGDVELVTALFADLVSTRSLARKVDTFELGLPPPDVLVLHSALRI